MTEELKACRYRVEKTGYGFWPYCVRAGDGTRELFKGNQKQCMVVSAELETAFEDGKFVADRANACQGGEAVEVVASIAVDAEGVVRDFTLEPGLDRHPGGYTVTPLMTVAQHQRILAAAVPGGCKVVPVERIAIALGAVQNAMADAYNNAYQDCCGRGQGECCGNPIAAWSDADKAIMDALAPAQRELSALLASAEGVKDE